MNEDYLNDWRYDVEIKPTTFQKEDITLKSEDLMGEIQQVTTLFPEFFVANKDKYLSDILELRGKHLSEYNQPKQNPQPNQQPNQQNGQPMPMEGGMMGVENNMGGESRTALEEGQALIGK